MKGGILKLLLLSNHPKPSIASGSSVTPPPATLLRYLSSLPKRPSRGGRSRGGRAEDDSEEEFFLRQVKSGDEKDDGSLQRSRNPPSRPPRGESRRDFDPGEDLFSGNINKKTFTERRGPPGGIPSRPMRGERRENPPRRQSFDLGDFGAAREKDRSRNLDLGGFGAAREEGSTKRLDFGDPEITFDKEEPGHGSEPSSLAQKLKFGGPAADQEELEVGGDLHGGSSRDEQASEESSEDADAIFNSLKKTGLIPNAVAMLDGLCKDGLVHEAMKLFGLMREKGTIPEVVIYTAVVEGFCRARKYDDAKRIFRKMQNNGIIPNAFSYGVIIQGFAKGKQWEDCVDFCLEMSSSGHLPNVAIFTGMVDGICKDKGLEEAELVLRRLREGGLALDEKAIRDHLDKRGPFSPLVREAIFGNKEFKNIF